MSTSYIRLKLESIYTVPSEDRESSVCNEALICSGVAPQKFELL